MERADRPVSRELPRLLLDPDVPGPHALPRAGELSRGCRTSGAVVVCGLLKCALRGTGGTAGRLAWTGPLLARLGTA